MSDSETLERLKAERLRAERQARQAVERERLAIQHAEERAAFEQVETERQNMIAALAERLEAERAAVEKMAPPFEGEILGLCTFQPKPSRNVANRLWDLCAAVKEIIAMEGQPDWRGLLAEALEDAKR